MPGSDVSICNGYWNTLSEHYLFTLNFVFKLFHVSIAIARPTCRIHIYFCNILLIMFKGELHPNQQLACVVLYLKIINFLKTDACILVQ